MIPAPMIFGRAGKTLEISFPIHGGDVRRVRPLVLLLWNLPLAGGRGSMALSLSGYRAHILPPQGSRLGTAPCGGAVVVVA